MKKKRFNNYKKLNILLKVIIVPLTAIIAFFSVLSIVSIGHTEKKVMIYKLSSQPPLKEHDAQIIQVPPKTNEFKDKLIKDIDNLKYDPYVEINNPNNFTVTSTPVNNYKNISSHVSNSYHKGTHVFDDDHDMTFIFSLMVNGIEKSTAKWDQHIDDNDTYGWVNIILPFNVSQIKPEDNITINLKKVHVKGDEGWDAGLSMNAVSSSESYSMLKNYIHGNTTSYDINNVNLHLYYDGYNVDVDSWFTGVNDVQVEVKDIDKATFDITTHNHIEKLESKKIFAKKIFISSADLKNKTFTQSELKQLVMLKDFNNSDLVSEQKNRSLIKNVIIKKSTKNLEVTIDKMNVGQNYYNPQIINIPIVTTNMDYLIQPSLSSSSYWEHLKTGETRYHSTKPETILELNDEFIKSLYILFKKNEIIDKINKDWSFVGGDKQIALTKVNSYAINIFNYDKIKETYSYNHNPNVFTSIKPPNFLKKYQNGIKTDGNSLEDYLYVLKNANFHFKAGSSQLSEYWNTIDQLSKGVHLQLSDMDIRKSDQLATSWNMNVSDLKLQFMNNNFIFSNNLKINLPNDNFENYDLHLRYLNGQHEESITHSYLYQNQGIDISKDITFIMEDGTLLDENYKVIHPSNTSNLKVDDNGYVTARYWATLNNDVQMYITLENNKGSWYSPKYKKNIQDLDSNFDINKLEYVFNQNLQMVVNPYTNTVTSKFDPTKPPNKDIQSTPREWKYQGEYFGVNKPSIPKGVTARVNSYLIDGQIGYAQTFTAPKGVVITPHLYHTNSELSKSEYDLLPGTIKNKFKVSKISVTGSTDAINPVIPSGIHATTYEFNIEGSYVGESSPSLPSGVNVVSEKLIGNVIQNKTKIKHDGSISYQGGGRTFGSLSSELQSYKANNSTAYNFIKMSTKHTQYSNAWASANYDETEYSYTIPGKQKEYKISGSYVGNSEPSLPNGVNVTKKIATLSGQTSDVDWVPPKGIYVSPVQYSSSSVLNKAEYDQLDPRLKPQYFIFKKKVNGIYKGQSLPPLPNGVHATVNSYYVSGVHKGTPASATSIQGVTKTPISYDLKIKSTGKPIDVIELAGVPRYGIKSIIDKHDGVEKMLEDWNDGKWSHTHDIDGLAKFDGVFGADMNGMFDSTGHLEEGLHKIKINLQNQKFTGLKQSFTIFIDKNPIKVDVSSPNGVLQKLQLEDLSGKNQELYFSNQPINFQIKNVDLKKIEAKFIDRDGNWYDLPINIASKLVDHKWVQTVNSTIDYAGFAKVIVTDQANNKSLFYFWLKQNNDNPTPKYDYELSKVFTKEKRKYTGVDLDIFNSPTSIKISSPLISTIDVSKLSLIDGVWEESPNNGDFQISKWDPKNNYNHQFGKTISSSASSLKFAGDELRPFITKNTDEKWSVENKIVKFIKPGLYKVSLQTRLIKFKNIDRYVYIKENDLLPVSLTKATTDMSNFNTLPSKDSGDQINIDKVVKVLKEINVKFPKFLIDKYKVFYSLPWYSEFNEILDSNFTFKKEGKYKIKLTDIFGKEYEYKILVIDKDIKYIERINSKQTPLSTPPPEFLTPYQDQLIFDNLNWNKDWNNLKINFNSIIQDLDVKSYETISKNINITKNMLPKSNKQLKIKILDQNDFNINDSNFAIWMEVKLNSNGTLTSWLYTTSDGKNDILSKKIITTFIKQITFKNIANKEINVFNNENQEKANIANINFYRQALLFSGASKLDIKFDGKNPTSIDKEDYGTKRQQIFFEDKKYNSYFTIFHLNENTEKDKSFYKGKNTWAYVRYEDEDHLLWEKTEFVKEAMRNGLTWDQAHNLYKHMKLKPTWNGDLGKLNWKTSDWKNKYEEYMKGINGNKNNLPTSVFTYKDDNSNSKALYIIFGVVGVLGVTLLGYVIFKRHKNRKIK